MVECPGPSTASHDAHTAVVRSPNYQIHYTQANWSPPANLASLLGLLRRQRFPLSQRSQNRASSASIMSRIEPHEIIDYLSGKKRLPQGK